MSTPLLLPNGDLNEPAIMAEIERRCAKQFARIGWANRPYHEHQVAAEAAWLQWPFVEAIAAAEWTEAERAKCDTLRRIYGPGGVASLSREADELRLEAAEIWTAVFCRAVRRFHAGLAADRAAASQSVNAAE